MKLSNHIESTTSFLKHVNLLLYFIPLFLLIIYTAKAQEVSFKLVPPPNSTSGHGVGVQDPQGYMWFAGNGLIRYDGYHYTFYINDPLDSNSLSGNLIESLYAARDGMIWIGTDGFGLNCLDPVTGIFTHYRHKKDPNSLSSDKITAIREDREGIIWVGTHSGLNRLDPKRQTIIRYQHNPSDSSSLSNNQVRVIYEDRQGSLWVGTGNAFIDNHAKAGGLNRMDRARGNFTRYLHEPGNPHSLVDNRVRAIFEDSRGNFWVGTAGDGLHTMNRVKGAFERHRYNPSHPEELSRPPLKKVNSWAEDHITFITEDATGAIWIGTLGNGISRYDPKMKKVTHFPGYNDPVDGEQQVTAWWALNSHDGILWIGYWNGLFQVDPLKKSIPFFVTGKDIYAIYEDASGKLWYGGNNSGLIRQDRKNGMIQRFLHNPRFPSSLSNNNVHSIYKDHQGLIWIGTDKGLNRFHEKNRKFIHYFPNLKNKRGSPNVPIFCLHEDKLGWLWVGTAGGLFRMDRYTGIFKRFINKNVKCIYEDKSNYIWIGSYLGGLNKLMPQTGRIQHFLYGADINSILQDSDGFIWVGTSSGLYRSDPALKGFSLFRDPGQEIPGNLAVGGILEDNQKTLWINTSIGILKLNPRRDELINYSRNQGMYLKGFYKGNTGELFFGDMKGYYAFYPEQLKGNPRPPQIVINEFRLKDQPVVIGPKSSLKSSLDQTKQIKLEYNQNVFSIRFAGIHYSNPEQNRHLFMLEGLDNTWRKGGEERTAYYYNIPPGHYTFRVKAASSDGVWAEKAIVVIVDPPWWRTWWAYLMYALLLVVAIWRLAGYRSRHLRHELEQRKKEQQLTELKQQKTELEMLVLRAQMNPHFIFNSLNSINRFILENNKDEASEYLTKFSKLIRLILHNSQAALIPLESELESLQLYLELECLRFDGQFEFMLLVEEDIDVSMLKIPPLTIQPYAENAIWHGLMHKRSKGHLEIKFWEKDDLLYCRIKDDGIGRKKASELKNNSKSAHKSVGMRITSDRIALLQQQKSIQAAIQINDLVLADSSSGGTEVIIQLPLTYD